MSLPVAKKDISEHPAKNAVSEPTDKAAMQADVDRKMRLYGVIEAFRQGKLPNNAQIDKALSYSRDHAPVTVDKLSPAGKKLIEDVRDIIETARVLVKEKNGDELFQQFIDHTSGTSITNLKPDAEAPITKESASADGEKAVQHLRTLLSLLLTNSEARKLFSDASLIGRDLFARGAEKAASKARPDQERLAHVDDAAPGDQFETANGRTAGLHETPVVQAGGVTHDPKTGNTDVSGKPLSERKDEAFAKKDELKDQAKAEGQAHAEDTQRRVDAADTDEEKADVAKKTLKEKIMGYKDRIPEDRRNQANEQYDKAKNFLQEEFPEERRDQFIYRLKKVVVECQKHKDYQESLQWFLDSFETYFAHGRNLAEQTHGSSTEKANADPTFQRATSELRTLLERFANGKSLDGVLNAAQQLSEDARQDEALRNYFKEIDTYVRKVLLEPGFVLSPQSDTQARQLQDQGRAFFDDKYRGHKDALFDAISSWFTAWGDDPLNKRFGQDWRRLTRDLLFDENGSLQFKPQLWEDIRTVILPQVIEQIGYVPIPRIEYTDPQLDLVIENLTLQGKNLFPNVISIDAHNSIKFSPYKTIKDTHEHDFKFTFSQIQADMRDVAVYFNKKTGMPKLKDSGLADVFLGGDGLTVKVHLRDAGRDKSSVFKVKAVEVKVDSLKFSVRDTKHDLLYKTLKPLATGLVKKQIAKAIQDAITTALEYVDGQLVSVRDKMAEAQGNDEKTKASILRELFERKKDEAASVAETAKKRDSQFKLVAKRDSVILHDKGHPGGWINKQAERQEAAGKGEGWQSEAFTIV